MQRILAWQTSTCTRYRYTFVMQRSFAFSKSRNSTVQVHCMNIAWTRLPTTTPSKRGRWFPLIFVQVHETCFFAFYISRFRECKESLHKRVPVPGTGTRLPCKDPLHSLNLEIVQVHCMNIAWTSPHDDPLKERSVVPPHICTGTRNLFLCVLYFSI